MTLHLPDGATVMFTGDSITDCQRGVTEHGLGWGYPRLVAGGHGAKRPTSGITWLNTGISGNRVSDLLVRWDEEVLAPKPDVLSVLVGINDCGRRFSGTGEEVSEADYRAGYHDLLERALAAGVGSLVLIEPFLLPIDGSGQRQWREDLDPKIQVVRDLAKEFGAHLLAADGMYAQLSATTGPEPWAADGVHPTAAGHWALAQAWLGLVS
ncbi:SGNH/GDSL hydrolase family protein [Aestuariimicrobium soli]|uniref:SGNH/GDSL hydrolase family protein n=1 Tax=Aestuariimicrobium soli TaxID=2035834 RepID=UPI003EBC722A